MSEKRDTARKESIKNDTTVIEVKSGKNTKAKAIYSVMSERYGVERGMEHYPLFAASFIRSMGRYGWEDLKR